MRRRPPRSTRTDTLFPYTRSSDLNRPPETPEHRKHRKQHESDNQEGAGRDLPGQRSDLAVRPRQDTRLSASLASRSEEHTSELQSLMRISYAAFCLKKKNKRTSQIHKNNIQTNPPTLHRH